MEGTERRAASDGAGDGRGESEGEVREAGAAGLPHSVDRAAVQPCPLDWVVGGAKQRPIEWARGVGAGRRVRVFV